MLVSSIQTALAVFCCLITEVSINRSDIVAADIGVKQHCHVSLFRKQCHLIAWQIAVQITREPFYAFFNTAAVVGVKKRYHVSLFRQHCNIVNWLLAIKRFIGHWWAEEQSLEQGYCTRSTIPYKPGVLIYKTMATKQLFSAVCLLRSPWTDQTSLLSLSVLNNTNGSQFMQHCCPITWFKTVQT